MPTETIVVLACIVAAFIFFAGMLVYGDMTWKPRDRNRIPAE